MNKKIHTMAADHWLKLLVCLVFVTNTQVHGDINVSNNAEKGGGYCRDGSSAVGTGQVQKIGGLNCYVNGPANSNKSVILASDVFGYEVPHLRQIADKVAEAGFYTLVPDFFHGDPYVSGRPQRPFQDWIKDHPANKGIKDAKKVIKALTRKGITKIGASGFCWGGKVVVDLTKPPYIRAAVLLHPTYVTVEDIQGVKVPISILGGQNDTQSPPSLLKTCEDALLAKKPKVNSSLKIFLGAEHGWTTRYNDTDAVAVRRAKQAHKEMLHWFVKYLK